MESMFLLKKPSKAKGSPNSRFMMLHPKGELSCLPKNKFGFDEQRFKEISIKEENHSEACY